jgi:hypothetical protein
VPEKRRSELPIGMEKVYRRLGRWRKIRRGREPIPKKLWAAAGAVAREHGINPKASDLEFKKLKQYVESGKPTKRRLMLHHWHRLALFLRPAGAPLDNNLCERALKKAILHRKNSLFYDQARAPRSAICS